MIKNILGALVAIAMFAWAGSKCSPAEGNKTGHEYMPDMVHPVTYEANTYSEYEYNNRHDDQEFSRLELSRPRKSVKGTIARGYTGINYAGAGTLDYIRGKNSPNAISAPVNSYAPFYYADSEEERTRAMAEIRTNPFPISKAGLAAAKPLYETNCGICHGEKGDGAGYLVRDGGAYPAQPANLINDAMISSTEGRLYYAIMYGKNVMGGYADKLNFEERWQVIHYIHSLQAIAKGATYDEAFLATTGKGAVAAPVAAAAPAPAGK
jgi:mono/diheme cytochrome c family protein